MSNEKDKKAQKTPSTPEVDEGQSSNTKDKGQKAQNTPSTPEVDEERDLDSPPEKGTDSGSGTTPSTPEVDEEKGSK